MRPLLFTLAWLIFLVTASAAFVVVSYVPSGLRLAAVLSTAEGCTPPQHVPANAGALVTDDLRQPGDGTVFSGTSREARVDATGRKLRDATNPARDLVVYVHGFRTSFADATCAGAVLRADLAGLPNYAKDGGPDVFVFGWPGEFRFWQFAPAQANAARAGHYLGGILQGLSGRRVILVAHSLGSEVVMTAASDLQADKTPSLAGILLIEGAIPAMSIRTWQSTLTMTRPFADLEDARLNKPQRSPFVEHDAGTGRFVAAAAKAAHLVVTTAGGDIPLSDAFALDETFNPSDSSRPQIPVDFGDRFGKGVAVQAVGTPFPSGKITRCYEEVLPDVQKPGGPSMRPCNFMDGARVMNAYNWVFEIEVPHPSYHEIRLDRGQWWRLLRDWHGIFNDGEARHRILSGSWAIFEGRAS